MVDPFCWIIAETKVEAEAAFQQWVFVSMPVRLAMEQSRVCFKGYHDAAALLTRRPDDGVARRIWRIDIGVTAVDVPRETSQEE